MKMAMDTGYEVCSKCKDKKRHTTVKKGRIITRRENEEFFEIANNRTKANKARYSQRQETIEHI